MRAAALAVCAAVLLAACAGGKRYAEPEEKNFVIRTEARSGSTFSSVRAVMGVHAVDAGCKLQYEGYVPLEGARQRVGVPSGRLSYLVFEFETSSFLGGTRGSTRRETLLRPRAGATYDVHVSYDDGLYDVVIRETPAGGSGRELAFQPLAACKR